MSLSSEKRHLAMPRTWYLKRPGGGGSVAATPEVVFQSDTNVLRAQRIDTDIARPATVINGGFLTLLFEIGQNGAVPVPVPPAGFLPLVGFPITRTDGGAFSVLTYAWQKPATGAEPAIYTVTHADAFTEAWMISGSGQNAVTPYSPNPTLNNGVGGGTTIALSLTTVIDRSLIIWWTGCWDFGAVGVPAGANPVFISRRDPPVAALLHGGTGLMTPQGVTGNKTIIPPSLGTPWAAGLIAIRP